jgi:antitoxin component YwqK of YwqJK toxin-antitoxin module
VWHYNGIEFTEDLIDKSFGFVYCITNLSNGRRYIGKKLFTKSGRKQTKGKIKKVRVTSDWLDYYGSNKELQEDVVKNGVDKFHREILHLCATRSECSYRETQEIFKRGALLTENYYNSWVTCKIHKAHVLGKF